MNNFSLVSSVCPKDKEGSTIFDRQAAGWTYGSHGYQNFLDGYITNFFFSYRASLALVELPY